MSAESGNTRIAPSLPSKSALSAESIATFSTLPTILVFIMCRLARSPTSAFPAVMPSGSVISNCAAVRASRFARSRLSIAVPPWQISMSAAVSSSALGSVADVFFIDFVLSVPTTVFMISTASLISTEPLPSMSAALALNAGVSAPTMWFITITASLMATSWSLSTSPST